MIGAGAGFTGALIRPDEIPIILHALKSLTHSKVFSALRQELNVVWYPVLRQICKIVVFALLNCLRLARLS